MNSGIEILNRDAGIYSVRVKWLPIVSSLASNAFIIDAGPENGLLVIDTGAYGSGQLIADGMIRVGLNPGDIKGIALSHWHSDHTGGVDGLVSIAGKCGAEGIKVFIHKDESMHFPGGSRGVLRFHPALRFPMQHTPGDVPHDGECEYVFLDHDSTEDPLAPWGLRFIHVPGHTPGNVSFYHGSSGSLFSGSGLALINSNTVGIMSVFVNREQQVESARMLASMDFKYLYPAHLGIRKDPIPPERRIPVKKISFADRARGLLPLFRYD